MPTTARLLGMKSMLDITIGYNEILMLSRFKHVQRPTGRGHGTTSSSTLNVLNNIVRYDPSTCYLSCFFNVEAVWVMSESSLSISP